MYSTIADWCPAVAIDHVSQGEKGQLTARDKLREY